MAPDKIINRPPQTFKISSALVSKLVPFVKAIITITNNITDKNVPVNILCIIRFSLC